jgi:hypothetical protein
MYQFSEVEMSDTNLKKHIAETAYNVGYTAKLHFASFDMIEKLPGIISFISMAFGVYALAYAELSTKFTSSTLLVLGIIGMYISLNNKDKSDYESKGIVLTGLFNELKHLMPLTEGSSVDQAAIPDKLKDIENRFNQSCMSTHVLFASWLAHYKFFWEQQIQWIADHKVFSFWRDKVPLSLWFSLLLVIVVVTSHAVDILPNICEVLNEKSDGSN